MIGTVVGNYKIIDKIGEGGMGSVFKGVDLMLEREVAIKMLRPELAQQPNVVERFRTEAVTLAKLNHPNVATLHSFFRQGVDFFMVMEFVRGETLDHVIRTQGAMPCGQAIQLIGMALEGIDHAHKMGIVHRDIKPANMMLTETGSIKVMDFGIARVLGTDRLTKVGHLIGTVEYMSPEQVRGEETDARSDIYSLGILLYEMLTGRVPFTSTSEYELMRCQIEDAPTPPRTFAPHIPLPVEQAIMRALAKKREARYQSASEFRAMLLQTTGSLPGAVEQPAVPSRGFVAPVLGAQTSRMTPPSSGDIVKATRLGDQNAISAASAGQIAETRLGPANAAHPYAQAPEYYAQPQPAAQGGPAQPSLLSSLTWKHLAGAGAVLVAIVGLTTFALVVGGSKSAPPPAPASVQSPPTGQSASTPVEQPPAQNMQTTPLPVATPNGGGSSQPPASGSNSGSERSRDSRAQKTPDTPTPTVPAEPAPSKPEPARAQPAPAPKQEHAAATRTAEKKEPARTEDKKDQKVSEKIGGAIKGGFKKLFGGDKKKDEKKP
jgi:serine/threonine-protein kinase